MSNGPVSIAYFEIKHPLLLIQRLNLRKGIQF